MTRDNIRELQLALQRCWLRWRQLSARTRIFGGVLVTVLAVLLLALGSRQLATKYVWLLSGRGFAQRELTAIQTAWASAGLDDYEVVGERIRIPADLRSAYVASLWEANALPTEFDLDLKEELSRAGPFESHEQRRYRWRLAEQRELAKIIRAVDGIEDATVHFDEVTRPGLRRERHVTAMVVIRPAGGQSLEEAKIVSIRHLVAAAKAGLAPADVTVTDLQSGMSYVVRGGEAASPATATDRVLAKAIYERQWRDKIQQLLHFIPGVQVTINVELASAEPSATTSSASTHDDPVGVSVVIGVPDSYYRKLWQERHLAAGLTSAATPKVADVQQIEAETRLQVAETVGRLMPADAVGDRCQLRLSVDTFPDLAASAGRPATGSPAALWLRQLMLPGAAVALLVIVALLSRALWGDLKRLRNGAATHREAVPAMKTARGDNVPRPAAPRALAAAAPTAAHQKLTQLVREDPDAAAAMLRGWINHESPPTVEKGAAA